ncbi:uncharacterized protein LOC144115174 isoform X1 [Amblyomma americanum]
MKNTSAAVMWRRGASRHYSPASKAHRRRTSALGLNHCNRFESIHHCAAARVIHVSAQVVPPAPPPAHAWPGLTSPFSQKRLRWLTGVVILEQSRQPQHLAAVNPCFFHAGITEVSYSPANILTHISAPIYLVAYAAVNCTIFSQA